MLKEYLLARTMRWDSYINMRASMRTTILKIYFFLSIFISGSAHGYIREISAYKNEKTGKWIYLMGDSHNLGTPDANTQQLKFFTKEILERFEAQKSDAQVLFENKYHFYDNLNANWFYKNYHEIFPNETTQYCQCLVDFGTERGLLLQRFPIFPQKGSGMFDGLTTWLADFARYVGSNKKPYQHVKLRSIDPRINMQFLANASTCLEMAGFAHIFQLGHLLNDLVAYMDSQPDADPLANELRKIQNDIEKDYEILLKSLKNHSTSRSVLSGHTIQELLNMDIISSDDLKTIKQLFEDQNFFLKALDKIALWESTKETAPTHSFVFVGFVHKKNLEEHLKSLGFKEEFRSENRFIKKRDDGKSEFAGDLNTLLPVGLKEEIEKCLMKVLEFAKITPSKATGKDEAPEDEVVMLRFHEEPKTPDHP